MQNYTGLPLSEQCTVGTPTEKLGSKHHRATTDMEFQPSLQGILHLCMKTCLLLVVVCLTQPGEAGAATHMNASYSFIWTTSEWTKCQYHDISIAATCCECYRKRNVTCLFTQTGEEVSPFYCRKLHPIRPPYKEYCRKCSQNCVLSLWGVWTSCSRTCGPASRHRVRQMLHPRMGDGEECDSLLESEPCMGLPLCSLIDPRPSYRWKVGPWTSCRKVRHFTYYRKSLQYKDQTFLILP